MSLPENYDSLPHEEIVELAVATIEDGVFWMPMTRTPASLIFSAVSRNRSVRAASMPVVESPVVLMPEPGGVMASRAGCSGPVAAPALRATSSEPAIPFPAQSVVLDRRRERKLSRLKFFCPRPRV